MEEQIYNIIKSNGSFDMSAKEITTHVMEFIEWKDNNVDFDIEDQLYMVMVETHIVEWVQLKKVYKYWLNNVKK